MKDEILRLANLYRYTDEAWVSLIHGELEEAIDKALAQPEQEPVEWQGLTDDEIDLLEELYAPPVHPDFVNDADHCTELIRHVEAKLKEKNHG